MRILHIFPTLEIGGQQVRLRQLILADRETDLEHALVSLNGSKTLFESLTSAQVSSVNLSGLGRMNLAKRLIKIRRFLREINPDILMTYNWGSVECALVNSLAGYLPHVHWEDGFGPDEQGRRLVRRNVLRRIALLRAARVMVPSRTLVNIARTEWHIPSRRLMYFPNGVKVPQLNPFQGERRGNSCMVGTVATLRQEKNLDLLINAFAALGGTHTLRIAGNGPMRAHLEALVLKRGLEDRVVFVGHIHDVPAFLAELDLFCITSTTEQMPISLLEAMAAGLPVVCTNVGDIAEMVAETNREWVVAEYDFTATLRLAVNSPDRWGAMSRDNFLRVSHEYAESAMLSRFRSMLHDVCHANAS